MTDWIKARPIAHRGLHDKANGIFENTLSAAKAAIAGNFSIEIDIHLSADGIPFVFHDNTLDRLTGETGPVRALKMAELEQIAIGGTQDRIPSLASFLDTVNGSTGLVIEMKGIAGEDEGFVSRILEVVEDYRGPLALMSFNHWLLHDARALNANVPLGLTAEGDEKLDPTHRHADREYRPDFLSYGISDLPNGFVREFRETGRPVITWTIWSVEDMAKSAKYADQITFEGFDPDANS